MTPFHPRLRRALFRDPQHRKLEVSGRELRQFEALSKQLEDEAYHAKTVNFLAYIITGEVIIKINNIRGIPDELIQLLKKLRDKPFYPKRELLDALQNAIGKNYFEEFGNVILNEVDRQPYFIVTEEMIKLLRQKKIRTEIIQVLEDIKYQKFVNRGDLLSLFKKRGIDLKENEIKLIINYAMRPGWDPSQKLEEFTNEILPNYKSIKEKFAKDQFRALKLGYYELNLWKIIKRSFSLLGKFFPV